jgi:hypothetical protein
MKAQPKPTVYLLLRDGDPIAVYVDCNTADYEMHLCQQGDEVESTTLHTYKVTPMALTTHRLD